MTEPTATPPAAPAAPTPPATVKPTAPTSTSAPPTPAKPASASAAAPAAPVPDALSGDEAALLAAKDVLSQNAPWKSGMRWEVVMIQGIVLGVMGAVVWLVPSIGAIAVLQLLGLVLLVTSLLSVWRLIRSRVRPDKVGAVAFRAGVGTTVGIIVILGSLIVDDRTIATVGMAIVLGVGLILYGLSAAFAAVARRQKGSGFPVVALLVTAATILVGLLLVLNGRNGIDALTSTFALLGILLLVVGLALVGWSLVMRSREAVEPED